MWPGEEVDPSPLKTSVTSLLRMKENILPEKYQPHEEEETVEVKRRPELPSFLLGEIMPRPAFMEEETSTAADIGSLTHRFLRLIDLTSFRGKDPGEYTEIVEKELERRVSEKNAPEILKKAMLYSLSAGGKRIRPCLMLH